MSDDYFASIGGSGEFFKPSERVNDLAIVFEFKRVLKDQPHKYDGIESKRDVAYADVYCFRNNEDLENGQPSLVQENCAITSQVLVADVESKGLVGKTACAVIRKSGRAYVYRDVEYPGAKDVAIEFHKRRNEEIAANLADAPSFD